VADPPDGRITVGLVRGLHGLRGGIRVEVLSDEPSRFAVGSVLFTEGDDRPLTIAWTGPAKPGLLVRFHEVTDRESAEALRDRYLEAIPRSSLPAETWYWHEVVGLEARTSGGEVLGRVSDIFRAGGGEVYVVTGGSRGEILVPATRSVIVELVPGEGRLVIDAGALGLGAPPEAAPATSD
jgi:16S rRNA processing protein RimM